MNDPETGELVSDKRKIAEIEAKDRVLHPDFEFASIPPNAILAKANFIAKIIEYILNTM